jgi:hypothetical protein
MKAHAGSGGIAPHILNLETRWVEWSASRHGLFNPEERAPGTRWIGVCVGPSAGLSTLEKRRNPIIAPVGNRTPVVQAVA